MNVNKYIISRKLSSRYLIHKILDGVFINRRTKNQTFDLLIKKEIYFKEKDIAQAERITNFIFGYLESIDYILSLILKKKTNLSVINIFRLVISELALKEAPNYALVNSAVDLAKVNLKTKYFLGLINAVSRRLVDKYQEKEFSLKSTLEKDFKNYLRKNYSNEIADNIEKTYTLNNTVDISIKNSNEIEIWKKKLKAVLLPTGSLRIKKNGKLSDIVGFKEGKWWVQNISSSIPVKLLGDLKGKEVLDLFSAPGGKAMQLIALGANVTCVDKSLQRIKKFEQNLIRMKMSTEIIQTDVYKFKSKKHFDIVLIDVPCSASGTIRKNKEVQYLYPEKRVTNLLNLQKDSLSIAKKFVKKDGLILYCNCSLFFSEGEDQIYEFIDNNKDWNFEKISKNNKYIEKDWLDKSGFLRIRPDHLSDLGGMDGFFAAILKKKI
tara:strand:+ start:2468 stop:3775 length:1308 start_codon:yes stop_codon:yes gene_type:complete